MKTRIVGICNYILRRFTNRSACNKYKVCPNLENFMLWWFFSFILYIFILTKNFAVLTYLLLSLLGQTKKKKNLQIVPVLLYTALFLPYKKATPCPYYRVFHSRSTHIHIGKCCILSAAWLHILVSLSLYISSRIVRVSLSPLYYEFGTTLRLLANRSHGTALAPCALIILRVCVALWVRTCPCFENPLRCRRRPRRRRRRSRRHSLSASQSSSSSSSCVVSVSFTQIHPTPPPPLHSSQQRYTQKTVLLERFRLY